ncbi:4-amino-4-deoxy-L-arabinose transferase [Hymenobacter gelipurpurascens]|uniref:4-amino-4-deoxy-L-arabinose transferase n=1 Tax=Hymenobacter gelipurpurascens TaxID=89968 RepID=A0A212TAI8_9BACT|nr:glycosyltransferase family 39 protein [Hymenobacter gelipurpurascens]SNC63063.1 4-amino-4-deoxy-L-arabinose transferase [Hymenobacter gelipurpurascens]
MEQIGTQPKRAQLWGRIGAVVVVCITNFFIHGGAPGVSLMEARNFVAAREMVAGGSWLIPTMNGDLRLAKPPLPTWAVAGLQKILGPTEDLGLLRLPAALVATLLVFFLWGLARELTQELPGDTEDPGRTAWYAALVVASSLLVITTGREGQWDIFAVSLMVGALWLLVKGWRKSGPALGWLAGAGLLGGMSLLSKGPVALYTVLLPFLVAYLTSNPAHRKQLRAHMAGTVLAVGLLLLVGLSWPWYIYQEVAPAALVVARTEISSWGDRHVKPFWFYAPFAVFTGIWALVTLLSLVWPYARPRVQRYIPYMLALGWALGGLVLLSLVPEKKERYMLPLMPPLALLVAGLIRYWEFAGATHSSTNSDKWALRSWGVILLLVCLAVPVAMAVVTLPGTKGARLVAAVVLFGGLAVFVLQQGIRPLRPTSLMGASLTGMAGLLVLLLPFYPTWERRRDTPGLRLMRDVRYNQALQGMPWYSLDTLHVKQVWSAGRAIPIWHLPASSAARNLKLPAVVFSASPIAPRIPASWLDQGVRVTVLDSFYLEAKKDGGYWIIGKLSKD